MGRAGEPLGPRELSGAGARQGAKVAASALSARAGIFPPVCDLSYPPGVPAFLCLVTTVASSRGL